MFPDPLHPAVVHFPIVLAFLLPAAALVALLVIRRGGSPLGTWFPVAVLAVLLLGSSIVAVRTGGAEEDRAERVVPEGAIHEHEEAAEAFLVAAAIGMLLALAGLAPGRVGGASRYATGLAALAIIGLAWNVGDKGGRLVYELGAAQAYANRTVPAGVGRREEDHDDDRREARERESHDTQEDTER